MKSRQCVFSPFLAIRNSGLAMPSKIQQCESVRSLWHARSEDNRKSVIQDLSFLFEKIRYQTREM